AGNYNVPVDSLSNFYLVNHGTVQADTIGPLDQDMMFMKVSFPVNTTATICAGDSFYFGGAFHYTAGTYYDTLHLAPGQDSVIVLSLSVKPLPSAAITTAGSTSICAGESITLNAIPNNNRTYQWKKGGTDIPGATGSAYTAEIGGVYKVKVTNTVTGCSKITTPGIVVTVNPLPTAVITPQGPTTFCAGSSVVLKANSGFGLTYKWKKDGVFISGANSINYTAFVAGTYKVRVTNNNSCKKTSPGTVVSVPCREEQNFIETNSDLSIFPNPSPGKFTIQSAIDKISQIIITNLSGQTIYKIELPGSTLEIVPIHREVRGIEIDLTNQPKGIYMVQVITGKEVYNQKIVLE
ncbi:MAG TPA: T9SS type A sorting domain-containing protein, partial [Bacteroidia bacterium]|nr:T9SS type A sorting domain-containing protein [Bacteroidia bacterium]